MPVSDCDNEDLLGFNPIMDKKRESGNKVAPHSARPCGPHFGSPLDYLQSCADLPNELTSETALLFLVVENRFPELVSASRMSLTGFTQGRLNFIQCGKSVAFACLTGFHCVETTIDFHLPSRLHSLVDDLVEALNERMHQSCPLPAWKRERSLGGFVQKGFHPKYAKRGMDLVNLGLQLLRDTKFCAIRGRGRLRSSRRPHIKTCRLGQFFLPGIESHEKVR